MKNSKVQTLSSFAWSIAEILRGDFKQSEYGKVILPFVVLRRLDCILEPTKELAIKASKTLPAESDDHTKDMIMFNAVGNNLKVYNYSNLTLSKIKEQDPLDVHKNLMDYITKFNSSVRDIFLENSYLPIN
jgi:type I restriction enzyme M protein